MIDLEEIKKKKKPIDEEGNNSSDETSSEDNEDNDQNFIDKWEQNSFSSQKKANVFSELKDSVKDAINNIKNATAIFTKKEQLRTLDREVGGTEENYEEASKKNDMDQDLWDIKEIGQKAPIEEITFESSQNESFIHDKKTKRGKRRARKMGPMMLNNSSSEPDKKLSFREKVKQFRTMKQQDNSLDDGGYEQGGSGGISM